MNDRIIFKNKKVNVLGLSSNKKTLPLHPANEIRETGDSCLDSFKVAHQNIFALGIICLSLCFLRDPTDLGVIAKGSYDFRKLKKRIDQIAKKYPKTHSVLNSLLLLNCDQIRYIDALKELSYERRSFTK